MNQDTRFALTEQGRAHVEDMKQAGPGRCAKCGARCMPERCDCIRGTCPFFEEPVRTAV